MKQSLLKDPWLHIILSMCFSELVLASLGKAGAVYPISSMCLVCTWVTWATWFVLEHGGTLLHVLLGCPAAAGRVQGGAAVACNLCPRKAT